MNTTSLLSAMTGNYFRNKFEFECPYSIIAVIAVHFIYES
jgi:hypothetical protein